MPVMQSPPGAETVIDGRRYTYFVGTGYLGLQGHPEVIRAAGVAARQYGIGSATSRAGFGDTPPLLEVERLAARFLGAEKAFYFVSGYLGNEILVRLIGSAVDAVFVDQCSHYCVLEAAQLIGKPVHPFAHRDPDDLAGKLRKELPRGGRALVMSDGVFAALGTIAPVAEYRELLLRYPGSALLVDDAHALGVLGENGRGTFEHAGLSGHGVNLEIPGPDPFQAPCLLICGTLSKAVGGFGGIVPGNAAIMEGIRSTSHYYEGASAMPVPVAAATAKALEIVLARPELRVRLHENVRLLKTGLRRLGLETDHTPVPIVSLGLGDGPNMRRIQRELAERGIMIAYQAAYSGLGPEGALRLAAFATHTNQQIERLLDEIARLL
jgi:7-keto-8-aminopelargonate synthetase-like enzyme